MTTSHEKNADLIASLRAGPECPGCAENLSPAQWWVDLALRLEKAVHCMGANSRANPHLQGVIETFESSATEAHDIAALLAQLPRSRNEYEKDRDGASLDRHVFRAGADACSLCGKKGTIVEIGDEKCPKGGMRTIRRQRELSRRSARDSH